MIENPPAAIEQEFKIKLPESLKLKVLEEDATMVYMVLPFIPESGANMELTEAELESVSGGISMGTFAFSGHGTDWPYC